MSELDDFDYNDKETSNFSIGVVIDNILNSINENIYFLIVPIVISSVLYLKEEFKLMDFNREVSYSMDVINNRGDDSLGSCLEKIQENTSLGCTLEENNIHLYKGELYIDVKR